ncbi:MAG TPA: YncE family protein [Planctomycetota bacterium]|nr:YncE family protein [Planctomycetota bacterium]
MRPPPHRPCTFLTLALCAAATGQTEPAPSHVDRLLVCNKADASLSIFDPVTRHEVAVVRTGIGPHEVAIAPDGRTAIVSDYGAQKPGSTLTVVDVVAGAALRTIELTYKENDAEGAPQPKSLLRPHGIQFVARDRLVFTSESARRLVLLDLTTDTVRCTWATPQSTMHMVALNADHTRAAATSIRDGNVALFDLGEAGATKPPAIVPAGEGSEGLAIAPRTGDVWVGNRAANTLTVVDGKTGVPSQPIATGDFPFRIAFTPDGNQALVSCAESGDVQVFDAAERKLVQSISIHADASELSAMPMGICTDPDGRFAYVACGRGEFVAVIDLRRGTVEDRIVARAGPDGIGYARFAASAAAPAVIR